MPRAIADHQAFSEDEIPTRKMCILCGADQSGPPKYCCQGRQELVERVKTPAPIRIHGECGGQGCEACKGTGVEL